MAMGFTLKSNVVPVGVYKAKFVGAEHTTHAEFGGGLKFEFEVMEGKYAGKSAFRTTGDNPTPLNVAGRVLAALAGAKPSEGLAIDADECVGREFQIVVGETQSGFTRVNEILPAKDDAPF